MAREYPKTLFHKSLPPSIVHTPEEEKKLGPGWYGRYIHQEYPRVMYGPAGEQKLTYSDAEVAECEAEGFQKTPFPVEQKAVVAAKPHLPGFGPDPETVQRIQQLEYDNQNLNEQVGTLIATVNDLRNAVNDLKAPADEGGDEDSAAGLPKRRPGETKIAYTKRVEDFMAASAGKTS